MRFQRGRNGSAFFCQSRNRPNGDIQIKMSTPRQPYLNSNLTYPNLNKMSNVLSFPKLKTVNNLLTLPNINLLRCVKTVKICDATLIPWSRTFSCWKSLQWQRRLGKLGLAMPTKEMDSFVAWAQGDRMSLWKNRPKCGPIHFLSKLMHNFNVGKCSPKCSGLLLQFKKGCPK
jgi:hypothetical protein